MKAFYYAVIGLTISLSFGCNNPTCTCDSGNSDCRSGDLINGRDIQQDTLDPGLDISDVAKDDFADMNTVDNGIDEEIYKDAQQDIPDVGEDIQHGDALADVEIEPPPDHEKWQLIYYHDYRDGPPDNGYGWGGIEFVKGGLKLTCPANDPHGAGAVYFTPFHCPNEWMMKTRFKLLTEGSEGQLLIRDNPKIQAESGIVMYDWNIDGIPNQGSVRQMMRGQNYDSVDYFTLPFDIEVNHWYTMTFSFSNGVVRGYVDGVLRIEVPNTPTYPGIYTEPHFTAQIGTAIFQTLEIYKKAPQSGE